MSLHRPLALIGYRATGKSTVGRSLATRLGASFVDTDDRIEAAANRTIAEIFANDGESAFRTRETAALQAAVGDRGQVISTGGGIVISPVNRDLLAGCDVVWLTASPAVIARRLERDSLTGTRRPSLTGRSVCDEVGAVLAQRLPLYEAVADCTIETDTQTVAEIVDQVAVWLSHRERVS